MEKLTESEFWNSIYDSVNIKRKQKPNEKRIKILIKKILGRKIFEYRRNYVDYLLWEVIYKKYLPKIKGLKVLEVGSAPGKHLVTLNREFGYIPYGIEYTKSGCELNRKYFIANNINPDNVIFENFFSDRFHDEYKEHFHIVVSRGFIEHFTDVYYVVEKHISLLKNGGYIVLSIPNLKGINKFFTCIFNRELIQMHNIEIMEKSKFLKLFDREDLITLFCDYCGTFDFGLFQTKKKSPMRFVLNFCYNLQMILNIFFRLLLKKRGLESRFFSPFLLYIGKKSHKIL